MGQAHGTGENLDPYFGIRDAGNNAAGALGPNASQKDIADARNKAEQDALNGVNAASTDGSVSHGTPSGNGNPGSADVGGGSGNGQMYHDEALRNMHEGDADYAANSAAMGRSIGNMSANRGQMSPENDALLRRESQSRDQQALGLDMQRQAAMGGAPSAADFQTRQSMDANMAGQAGAAGSARGLSGLGGVQGAGAAGAASAAGGVPLRLHGGAPGDGAQILCPGRTCRVGRCRRHHPPGWRHGPVQGDK